MMIKFLLTLVLALVSLICNAQFSETRTVSDFKTIEASTGIEVVFEQDNIVSVTAESNTAENLGYIITEVSNQSLKIRLKNHSLRQAKFKVVVSAPTVTSFSTNSGSSLKFGNGISQPQVSITASSGSSITGNVKSDDVSLKLNSGSMFKGKIDASKVSLNGHSGSSINCSGIADNLTVDAGSASVIDAEKLTAKHVTINAANAATVTVTATESIDANADSAATIRYYGSPTNEKIHKSAPATIAKK